MNNKETLIINIIRYTPIIFVPILLTLVISFIYNGYVNKFIEESALIESQYIKNEKDRIKAETLSILEYIKSDEKEHFKKLKKTLLQSVNNGHATAVTIYNKYKNTKSKKEIFEIIKTALRNFHPQKDNRYFFIYSLDGKNILHPTLPKLEDKNLWDYKDSKGTLLLQEMNKILQTKDSTYYSWYWTKPSDSSNKEYQKLGYFKKIKELNCFIGLGIYIDDFKKDMKEHALQYISSLRYKNNGFVSIIDFEGNILSHISERLHGFNILHDKKFKESSSKNHFMAFQNNTNLDEKFSQFSVKVASTKKLGKQRVIYTKKFTQWEWYINHSFNLDEVKQIVKETKELKRKHYKESIEELILYSLVIGVILLFIGHVISQKLINVFIQYKEQLKEQLKESQEQEQKYLTLSQQYSDFIEDIGKNFVAFRHDLNGKVVFVTKNFKNLFGMEVDSILNKHFTEINWTKDSLDNSLNTIKKISNKEISSNQDIATFIHPLTNEERTIQATVHGQKDSNGNIIAIEGILEDITERKKQEKLILTQKEEFESIFNYSKDGIAIFDLDSRFLDCNKAYLDMLGFTLEEIKQKTCIELTAPEYKEKTIEALNTALQKGGLENFEKVCITKDGGRVHINMTSTLLPDKKRFLVVTKNVTALKHIEEQSKLASMGEMIGNIAHQWRQPLSIISTASTGVLFHKDMGTLTDKFIDKEMNMINDNAQYLSQTIEDFRDFIKGDSKFADVLIKDVINSALTIVGPAIKNNYITLDIDIDESIMIHGCKNELEQVLINIMNNSKDIIKEKEMDDGFISIKTTPTENNNFDLIICDNGGGIPKNILPNIFDPYFTTKHKSKGTGLGLSMVEKIIRERHHQKIKAYNSEITFKDKCYKGACFAITFKRKP